MFHSHCDVDVGLHPSKQPFRKIRQSSGVMKATNLRSHNRKFRKRVWIKWSQFPPLFQSLA